jgi:hypothetical protein
MLDRRRRAASTSAAEIAHVRTELSDMGVSAEDIEAALRGTGNGTVDECIQFLERMRSAAPAPPPPEPKRTLSPAGMAMRDQLIEFGYPEDLVVKALFAVGPDSVERLIDAIIQLQQGATVEAIQAPQPPRLTPEQIEQRTAALRARATEQQAQEERKRPMTEAENELRRRREVLAQVEAKKKYDETQRQLAATLAAKEKIEDERARGRVLEKIAAQKGEAQKQPQERQQPAARTGSGDAVLRFNIQGVSPPPILTFPAGATFAQVDAALRQKCPELAQARLQYTAAFPPVVVVPQDWAKALGELGLAGRNIVNVTILA